jgi:hypothetical protein
MLGHGSRLALASASLAAVFLANAVSAQTIDLTTGTTGSLTGVPQSFNETRGVDVTVLSAQSVAVNNMRLDGLFIGGASSALVGARIYRSSDGSLAASANMTVFANGSVTVPISATLGSGLSYRVSFFVSTTPSSLASGTMYDPDPPSIGLTPYTESSGTLRINSAHESPSDAFPTNANSFVPLIKLGVVLPINVTSGTTGSLLIGQSFNETRATDITVLSASSLTVTGMSLSGLMLGGATSALVGARIYDGNTAALLASANVTATVGGTITVPISAVLAPGGHYRAAFFVGTTPASLASGNLFDPAPAGAGGFPYVEYGGRVRINGGFQIGSDSFPTTMSATTTPQITIHVASSAGTAFCFGDGSEFTCPCSNSGMLGRGCNNSSSTGGALLFGSGNASLASDTLFFTTAAEKATATSTLTQGQTAISPLVFGQGMRCVGGSLKRLYTKVASGGSIVAPTGADPSVHTRSATLGDVITAGSTRYYYVYYRDPTVLGGCSAASTFNVTHQLAVLWGS